MYRINDILTIYIYIILYNYDIYIISYHTYYGYVIQVIAYDQWQNQWFESLGHPYYHILGHLHVAMSQNSGTPMVTRMVP